MKGNLITSQVDPLSLPQETLRAPSLELRHIVVNECRPPCPTAISCPVLKFHPNEITPHIHLPIAKTLNTYKEKIYTKVNSTAPAQQIN